tara:strand:- start:790 stop:2175 length:1386 start_codon:yes stop_codon:yes gene_type:complete
MSKATNIASLLTANGRVKAEKSGSAGAPVRVDFTATENQTTKTGLTYTVGDIDCYINGSKMMIDADFTASDGVSVTFAVALNLGDEVQLIMGVAMGSGVAPIATGGTVTITDGSTGGGAVSYDVNTNFSFSTGSIFSSYAVQSGALPTGTSLDTATGVISGTVANATVAYPFTIRATDTDYDIVDQLYSWDFTFLAPVGEAVYTTPATYSWVCPAGVTSVSVVCIGAGGFGGDSSGVGGGDSYFMNTSTVKGGGGVTLDENFTNSRAGGSFAGDGGGNGGGWGGGDYPVSGGGAGGYSGDGGRIAGYNGSQDGNDATLGAGADGAGGGGGSGGVGTFGSGSLGGGGGGVGVYGEGTNGSGGSASIYASIGGVGAGGSSGLSGSSTSGGSYGGGSGGGYGQGWAGTGGGLGYRNTISVTPGASYTVVVGTGGTGSGGNNSNGANGAVRIIWGDNRSFPYNAS